MKSKESAKKRIMFIQNEDYNFLTYNILIFLNTLGCTSKDKTFRDFKKIAYLIEFIANTSDINSYTPNELKIIYSRAQLKKQLISHLLVVLKNRKFIGLNINSTHKSFDLWVLKDNLPLDFFDKQLFKKEIENINGLKQLAYSLKTVPVKDLVYNIFTKNNVITWEI